MMFVFFRMRSAVSSLGRSPQPPATKMLQNAMRHRIFMGEPPPQ